jgi:hypothetical protein
MEWLCWLFGALIVITLVGHGIWALIAKLLKPSTPKLPPHLLDASQDERVATIMQMMRLLDAGLIDSATYQRVVGALDSLEHRRIPPPIPVLPIPLVRDTTQGPPVVEPARMDSAAEDKTATVELEDVPRTSSRPAITDLVSATVAQELTPPRTPAIAVRPPPPRRSLSELFASFLRESNIRWGELIGGLLIIGCSIALATSFWNKIEGRPLFQFGMFTGVTVATFALGLYAEHRWKLPTTSRGILLIAMALVPLNFLAFAALSHGRAASALVASSEVAALGIFGLLVFRAARILAPYWPGRLTFGVICASASLLITKDLSPVMSLPRLLALGIIPIMAEAIPMFAVLWQASRWKQIRGHVANAIFLLLGVLTFAAGLAMSLVLFQGDSRWRVAHDLSPLLSFAVAPALATGLFLWRKITDKRLAKIRTIGTAIGVAAAFLMLGTIALAWPDPSSMLPLAAVDFVVLTAIAVFFDFSAAHALAGTCLLLTYVLGFELLFRHVGWTATSDDMARALIAAHNGTALLPLCVLTGAVAWLLSRQRRAESGIYAWMSVAVALISIALVSQDFGRRGDPNGATLVYFAYAIVALWTAVWLRRDVAGWAGCSLLFAALAQFFITRTAISQPLATALLTYATIAIAGIVILRRSGERFAKIQVPARWSAIATSAVAAAILIATLSFPALDASASRLLWVSVLWFVVALTEGTAGIFLAAQIALALAAALGTVGRLAHHSWFLSSPWPLLEPWTLQSVGVVLASITLSLSIAGVALPRKWLFARWLNEAWTVGHVLSLGLAGELLALVLVAIVPAAQIEFSSTGSATLTAWSVRAMGGGSWALWAILLLIFAGRAFRRAERASLMILLTLVMLSCPLWAARWAGAGASASALRWALAVCLVAMSVPLWTRQRLPRSIRAFIDSTFVDRDIRLLLTALAALPILALSVYPVALTLAGQHFAGPNPGCFFFAIGEPLSYVFPMVVVALVFVGYAIRERSGQWAGAAGAVSNLAVTLGYALTFLSAGQQLDLVHVIRLVQLNVLTLGLFAIAWQALRALDQRTIRPRPPAPVQLRAEAILALTGVFLLIVPATLWLIVFPDRYSVGIATVGDPLGWICLGCALAGAFWARGTRLNESSAASVATVTIAVALMAALTASPWNPTSWLGFHVLMVTTIAATGAILAVGVWIGKGRRGRAESAPEQEIFSPIDPPQPIALEYARHDQTSAAPIEGAIFVDGQELRTAFRWWISAISGFALCLALRAMAGDPLGPWWSVGTTATLSLLWTGLACWLVLPSLLYVGGVLLNLAVTMWWMGTASSLTGASLTDLADVNISVLGIFGLATLVLHLTVFQVSATSKRSIRLPFHRVAAAAALLCISLIIAMTLSRDIVGQPVQGTAWICWGALGSVLLLTMAMLWDSQARFAILELYILGLTVTAYAIHFFYVSNELLEESAAIALSGYVVLTGILGGFRDELFSVAKRLRIPAGTGRNSAQWLAPANVALALIAIGLAIACDFTVAKTSLRVGVATAVLFQIIGLVAIGRSDRRVNTRVSALSLAALANVVWGWAWMSPSAQNWLDRLVILMVALTVTTIAFAMIATRWHAKESPWSAAARMVLGPVAVAGAVALLGILSLEIVDQVQSGSVQMHFLAIIAVLGTLLGTAAGSLVVALRPQYDPLHVPENKRGMYVYASEVLLMLAFMHLRLTMPRLFGGAFTQYWPLVVMGLAFGGVALAELFQRRGSRVLASPLFRTGVFLPLLPVLAFWMVPSRVDLSVVLFTAGVFYASVSVTRKSFVFGVLAALAGNGGLWSLLYHQPEYRFLLHPQMWVIPGALSALVAAQMNRDRLSAPQLRFVRYGCLMAAYVSSTADIFLCGVRDHPWLPLVLATLSVAGVFAGILFRVRAFLFLGTTFLVLAIVTMIYYASANLNWTWLWYVAGIALGAAIIILFALFEKKRSQMLALVDGLKSWQ